MSTAQQSRYDVRLQWDRVYIWNNEVIETSDIYHSSTFSLTIGERFPDYKHWITEWSRTRSILEPSLLLQGIKSFVDYISVFDAERVDLGAIGLW